MPGTQKRRKHMVPAIVKHTFLGWKTTGNQIMCSRSDDGKHCRQKEKKKKKKQGSEPTWTVKEWKHDEHKAFTLPSHTRPPTSKRRTEWPLFCLLFHAGVNNFLGSHLCQIPEISENWEYCSYFLSLRRLPLFAIWHLQLQIYLVS